jgi:methyl-accepting chemotaxis protein
MNLDNLPGQLLALMLGWSFTVFIQNRSNRRAEALKRKDKIVDKLEDVSDWVDGEISKANFSFNQTETSYSGMISQIEVRINQLNNHVGRDIFDSSLIARLREIEIFESAEDNAQVPYKIREAASDIIENIEACCDAEYFGKRGFLSVVNDYYSSLKGIAMALISALLLVAVFQFFYKYVLN